MNSIKILLADDDADDRLFFKEAIEELGLNISINLFQSGTDLLNYLSDPDLSLPDLVFLDLNMPCKSGLECLGEIRKKENLKYVALAIYSTSSSEEDIEKSYSYGATMYIKKPNKFDVLKMILSKVVATNWQHQKTNLSKEDFVIEI
ncbi:MAG: response regulator [Cyclobacteriaceae bacterium]